MALTAPRADPPAAQRPRIAACAFHEHHHFVSDASAQDAYLGKVRGLRIDVGEYFPADALVEVDSLIDHDEPAEGVCSLAWALHVSHVTVPAWVNEAIRDLTDGLVDSEHLPPRLPQTGA